MKSVACLKLVRDEIDFVYININLSSFIKYVFWI